MLAANGSEELLQGFCTVEQEEEVFTTVTDDDGNVVGTMEAHYTDDDDADDAADDPTAGASARMMMQLAGVAASRGYAGGCVIDDLDGGIGADVIVGADGARSPLAYREDGDTEDTEDAVEEVDEVCDGDGDDVVDCDDGRSIDEPVVYV